MFPEPNCKHAVHVKLAIILYFWTKKSEWKFGRVIDNDGYLLLTDPYPDGEFELQEVLVISWNNNH